MGRRGRLRRSGGRRAIWQGALNTHIGGFHQAYPGAKIEPTSKAAEHQGKIHFTWRMVMPDGTIAIDFGELDATGRIGRIVGFSGPPAAL